MKDIFTTGQVAKICNVSLQTIIRCFDSGMLKGFRIPGRKNRARRIPRKDLIAFLKINDLSMDAIEVKTQHEILVVGAHSAFMAELEAQLPPAEKFALTRVSSGFDAGVSAAHVLPQTVIIDLAIGHSESFSIATGLREQAGDEPILIIAMTPKDDLLDEFLTRSFGHIFERPCDMAAIASCIRDTCLEEVA